MSAQQFGKLIGRNGLAEVITLHLVAGALAQEGHLLLRFHAFSDDGSFTGTAVPSLLHQIHNCKIGAMDRLVNLCWLYRIADDREGNARLFHSIGESPNRTRSNCIDHIVELH